MSTKKVKKVSAALLTPQDITAVEKVIQLSEASESTVIRGFIRAGIEQWKKRKITTLELIRLGAYSGS